MKEEQYKRTERAFRTGHYPTLTQAVVRAMHSCLVWRMAEKDVIVTMESLFEFAKHRDQTHPLRDGQFYMVSLEGAIGLSPGVEYLTEWIFIPMEPGEQRDAIVKQLAEEYDRRKAAGEFGQTE